MKLKITMKLLRTNAGLTAQAVANELGVSESSIRNWDKGRTEPKLKISQFHKLTQLYGCSFDDLVGAVKNSMASHEQKRIKRHDAPLDG